MSDTSAAVAAQGSASQSSTTEQSDPRVRKWESEPARPFVLTPEAREFFLAYYSRYHQRQLSDDEIVSLVSEAHRLAMQTHPYRCVKECRFSTPRIMRHPRYAQLVQRHPDPASLRVLDIGSCMGSDVRQLLLHSVSPQRVLGLELERDFIDIGLDVLFQDRGSLSSAFIAHDILTPDFLSQPTLTAFRDAGIDLIYAGSVYHLLLQPDTVALTQHSYELLKPGGVFFGRTVGSLHPVDPVDVHWIGKPRFLHSAATFTAMMQQCGFAEVEFAPVPSDMDDSGNSDDSNVSGGGRQHSTGMFAFYARKPDSSSQSQPQ